MHNPLCNIDMRLRPLPQCVSLFATISFRWSVFAKPLCFIFKFPYWVEVKWRLPFSHCIFWWWPRKVQVTKSVPLCIACIGVATDRWHFPIGRCALGPSLHARPPHLPPSIDSERLWPMVKTRLIAILYWALVLCGECATMHVSNCVFGR